jgi:putative transposase
LALSIEGANRHDSKLLFPTLNTLTFARPEPMVAEPQNLCLDAAYDHDPIYGELYERGYEPHVQLNRQYHKWYQPAQEQTNSLEPSKTPRRWVVERLFSWLNRWRRLLVRWEKLGETYQAFLQLACGLICFHYTSRL